MHAPTSTAYWSTRIEVPRRIEDTRAALCAERAAVFSLLLGREQLPALWRELGTQQDGTRYRCRYNVPYIKFIMHE